MDRPRWCQSGPNLPPICPQSAPNLLPICSQSAPNLLPICSQSAPNLLLICSQSALNLLPICNFGIVRVSSGATPQVPTGSKKSTAYGTTALIKTYLSPSGDAADLSWNRRSQTAFVPTDLENPVQGVSAAAPGDRRRASGYLSLPPAAPSPPYLGASRVS